MPASTRQPDSTRLSLSRRLLYVAGPSALIATPFLGLAFHSDQRIMMYWLTGAFGANPLRILNKNIAEIDGFLSQGNFRPVGRFILYVEQTTQFEIAAATGVPPHIVQGGIRVIMVGLLALAATCVVMAFQRSLQHRVQGEGAFPDTGCDLAIGPRPPMIETFPLLFASTMVVTGPLHPISFFPFFLITMVVAILLVPLYIASDGAMTRTGISKQEAAWAALLGMLAAMTFELLYLLPLTCLVMIVARGMLSGLSSRAILHSTAFSRFIAFCAGFLLVFVPSRIFIAVECAQNDCYENSELVVSGLSLKQWLGRASSGLPWDSWLLVLRGDISAALSPRGLLGALSDAWLFLVAVALVLYAIRAGRRLVARENPRTPKEPQRRLGLTVIALGLIFSSMSSLMVSLSQGLQRWNEIGLGLNQWRDTLLVQVGWAFILYGLLIFISSFLHGRSSPTDRSRIWIGSAAAIALLGMAMFTLIANDRYALRRRSEPVSNIVNLISTATVEFDDTDAGQAIRCELLSSYEQLTCKDCWHSGTRLTEELNNLSRSKHGSDFCPTSIRDAESVPPSGGAAG